MAKGNWKPSVIKPRTRCQLCGGVIKVKETKVYINGYTPVHKGCAERKGKEYATESLPPVGLTYEEDKAADAFEFYCERFI